MCERLLERERKTHHIGSSSRKNHEARQKKEACARPMKEKERKRKGERERGREGERERERERKRERERERGRKRERNRFCYSFYSFLFDLRYFFYKFDLLLIELIIFIKSYHKAK